MLQYRRLTFILSTCFLNWCDLCGYGSAIVTSIHICMFSGSASSECALRVGSKKTPIYIHELVN